MKEYKTTGFNYIRHINVFQTITCICRHENTHPYKLGAIGINRVEPTLLGPATETTLGDWHGFFKGHRREWAGKLSWNAFGGGKIPMHWDGNCLEEHDGFAPTSLFAKRNFWSCTEREYVLTPAQCIVQPGVGRPAGMWKAQPLELGMEPRELAARAFPSPGDCKVFVLLLSLSHSFISSETHWFTGRWRGKSSLAITKCPCEMEKLGFTQLCSEKKMKGRGESGCLKPAHRSGGGWWSMPGIPPPRCQTGPWRSQPAGRC